MAALINTISALLMWALLLPSCLFSGLSSWERVPCKETTARLAVVFIKSKWFGYLGFPVILLLHKAHARNRATGPVEMHVLLKNFL
jgi:hypothetical protein